MLFASAMAIFSFQRLVVYGTLHARFDGSEVGDVLTSFLYGLRYDAVVACMLVAPLWIALIPAPPVAVSHRFFRWFVSLYAGLVLAAALFLSIADYFFFEEFGERLNEKAVHYIHYDYVLATIAEQFPLWQAVLAAVAAVLGGGWLIQRFGFDDHYNVTPLWQAIVWPGLLVALTILGIRGSLGPKSLNTGLAFFSGSPALTQLTLNGVFTLRQAIISEYFKGVDLDELYRLLPEDRAFEIARQALARPQDTFLADPENPLRRVTDTGRPQRRHNVVLVVLESMSWHYIGALGGDPRFTPNLNALAAEGVLMDRCFAVGGRTTNGFAGIVAGFPDLPGSSVTTRAQAHRDFFTLGTLLREREYETLFIYGGQPYYDHRQAFLGGNGYSRFVFEDDFVRRTFRTHLGWCDEDLFETAHETFSQMGDKPFFATLLTLAFHRDYQIPPGKVDPVEPGHRHGDQMDAVRYTDWAIGRFMEKARQAPYFDDTIFVFVADHSGGFLNREPHPSSYRVPFLIYAPAILDHEGLSGKTVSAVCSQADVGPTILWLLGGQYAHTFFGSSVLSRPADAGMALLQPGDGHLVLIDGQSNAVAIPPHKGPARLLKFEPPDRFDPQPDTPQSQALRDELARRGVALLQAADILYERRSYNLGRGIVNNDQR